MVLVLILAAVGALLAFVVTIVVVTVVALRLFSADSQFRVVVVYLRSKREQRIENSRSVILCLSLRLSVYSQFLTFRRFHLFDDFLHFRFVHLLLLLLLVLALLLFPFTRFVSIAREGLSARGGGFARGCQVYGARARRTSTQRGVAFGSRRRKFPGEGRGKVNSRELY